MSRRPLRRCKQTRKVMFRDRIAAEMVILRRQGSDQARARTEGRSYLCRFCHRWHLTSQPKATPAAAGPEVAA